MAGKTDLRDEIPEEEHEKYLPELENTEWKRHVSEQELTVVSRNAAMQPIGQYTYTDSNDRTHAVTLVFHLFVDEGAQWGVFWDAEGEKGHNTLDGINQIWNDPYPDAKDALKRLTSSISQHENPLDHAREILKEVEK